MLKPIDTPSHLSPRPMGRYKRHIVRSRIAPAKTADAVDEAEELPLGDISKRILDLDDVDERWETAVEFTEQTAGMISSATDVFSKSVNGSCGGTSFQEEVFGR
eukprot:GHVU01226042.1.p1 GENE.GHVU01226042.1~~GHVU01226042.1.p1  ORF type:complete len:104 (+),score=8.29 GHVU01226042.1:148-459(+)